MSPCQPALILYLYLIERLQMEIFQMFNIDEIIEEPGCDLIFS